MAAGNQRQTGSRYEQKAADYLTGQGFQIRARNFYSRFGEIDLIAQDGAYLVFIEVKYRKNGACGTPVEAVTAAKQRRICRTALYYCMKNGYGDRTPCRFDVVAIEGEKICHIQNAFEFHY